MFSQFRRFISSSHTKSVLNRAAGAVQAKIRRGDPSQDFGFQSLEPRRLLADISGAVFHDLNADAIQGPSEKLQSGFKVFADLNHNGQRDDGEPSGTSDGFGQWAIHGLTAGTYAIAIEQRDGFTRFPMAPAGGYHFVHVSDTSVVKNLDFGVVRYASASGSVFFDVDGNGVQNAGEIGQAGVTVYVDANANGQLDTGEQRNITNAQGQYRIDYLYPGVNTVRIDVSSGMHATAQTQRSGKLPSGYGATNLNFGVSDRGSLFGHVFSDNDGDGLQGVIESDSANQTVYLDLNNNGRFDPATDLSTRTNLQGDYLFNNLAPGTYRVRIVEPAGKSISNPSPTFYTINLQPSENVQTLDFGLAPYGRIRGYVFGDNNSDGVKNGDEVNLAGRKVFIDFNGNRSLDDGEPIAYTNVRGEYLFPSLPAGRYFVDMVVPAGQIKTTPVSGRHIVTVVPARATADVAFGVALTGEIHGRVFEDLDGNGILDPNESGIASVTVFLDLNKNGVLNVGEPRTVSDVAGNYVFPRLSDGLYDVRVGNLAGASLSTPAGNYFQNARVIAGVTYNSRDFGFIYPATVMGYVFGDLNGNQEKDITESSMAGVTVFADYNRNGVLNAGEPSTVSGATGMYTLNGVRPGWLIVRPQLPPGFHTSLPNGTGYSYTILSHQIRTQNDFGIYEEAAISGNVYGDIDGNGTMNGGETGAQGLVVYLDIDNNQSRNPGEPYQTTDSDGDYAFTAMLPGTYSVRLDAPPQSTVTDPGSGDYANTVVASGQSLINYDFGVQLPGVITGGVYTDANSNGTKDSNESWLSGATIYADLNDDALHDPGEPFATSAANGTYRLVVPPGTYDVRVLTTPGHGVIEPLSGWYDDLAVLSQQVLSGYDFGIT